MNKIFSILLILPLYINAVFSQVSVEKSKNTVAILGKTYYLHEVKKGQTIYSICKVYEIEEASIYAANRNLLKSGLKYGTTVKVPVSAGSRKGGKTHDTDKNFTYHTVQSGETVYSLAKSYCIDSEVIKKLNSNLKSELRVGQRIKLPVAGVKSTAKTRDHVYHVILPSETLFSIAQRYGLTIADIEMNNPELLENGISVGQELKIPKHSRYKSFNVADLADRRPVQDEYEYTKISNTQQSPCNSYSYNPDRVFKIAVMLPLFIEENKEHKTDDTYFKNTEKFYEFYYGLMLAAKEMKKQGLSVEFLLEDTRADAETTRSILSSMRMKDIDLIIGPIHSFNFKQASDFALNHNINIVAPFKLKTHSRMLSNPAVFLANPGLDAEVANISSYLTKSLNTSVLMLHNGTKEEQNIINLFRKNLLLAALPYENINEVVFKNLNYKTYGITGVENALSAGLYNVIVVPSNNQVFITNIATKLNYLTKRYRIELYAMRAWERLRNIEISYLCNLGFHYGSTSYVDLDTPRVKTFKEQYKRYFNALPSHYSYMGYDIAYYFMNVLKDFGKNFHKCVGETYNKEYAKGLQFDFNFKQEIPYQGFENDWISIVKIDKNFKLVRVN